MFKKIFLLSLIISMIPLVVASPDIFSLSKSVDSVTYPDNNTITISFSDPNLEGIVKWAKEIIGWTKTYENVNVGFSIQGNAVFGNGETQITKEYGTINSAITDSMEIAITEGASCKGEPIIVTATTTYEIVDDKKTTIPKEPEIQTISFEGRYCENVICEQQLKQCKDDKQGLFEEIDQKEEDMRKLQVEKDEKIEDLEIRNDELGINLEHYKNQLSKCNSTLADSKEVVIEKKVMPTWGWVVIIGLVLICLYLKSKKQKPEKTEPEHKRIER